MEEFFAQFQTPFQWALLALFVAKCVTVITPSRADNKALDAILRGLNMVAMNVGRDKNFDAVLRKSYEDRAWFNRKNGGGNV